MQSKLPGDRARSNSRKTSISSVASSSSRPSSVVMPRKFSGSHRVNQSDNHVNVAIRCRPLSEKEIAAGYESIVDFEDGNKIIIHNISESPSDQLGTKSGERHNYSQVFEFDAVFDCNSSQEEIYNQSCRAIVNSVLEGYNGTIFAYGQTGAGKTYTMEGATSRVGKLKKKGKATSRTVQQVATKQPKIDDRTRRRDSSSSIGNNAQADEKMRELKLAKQQEQTTDTEAGIIPRAFEQIFEHIAKNQSIQFLVRASYLEIYQEEIHDLLKKDKSIKLELHEKPGVGVYVKDLTSFACKSMAEIERVMRVGNQNRQVGATDMNEYSSRSHAIFMITIEQQQVAPPPSRAADLLSEADRMADGLSEKQAGVANRVIKVGKLNLVDLAGSERQRKTNSSGQRQKESIKINLSLSALGNVINSLMKLHTGQQQQQQLQLQLKQSSNPKSDTKITSKSSQVSFTPYRDSKLTRLLQDSLGGNAKTLMIANIGPASYNYDETINTLNYASRAKCIRNQPKLNEDPKDALLRELQREIDNLRSKLSSVAASGGVKLITTDSNCNDDKLKENASVSRKNSNKEKVEQELLELRQKLFSLESKLLNGVQNNGEQILHQRLDQKLLQGLTQTQELELAKRRLELASQVSREQEIRDELERREKAELLAKKSFTSIQQEVDSKRQLIRKVLIKIKSLRDETERIQETYRLELEELDQLQYVLQKELKLKCLIMDNFIPNTHVDQLLPRIFYDERRNSCSIMPVECPLDYCLNYEYHPNQTNWSSLDRYENYWQPADGISSRPRSEFERLGETIYPGNIRFKLDNLIETKLEFPKVNPIKRLDRNLLDKAGNEQEQSHHQPPERSNIQELIDVALNQRESDIVI